MNRQTRLSSNETIRNSDSESLSMWLLEKNKREQESFQADGGFLGGVFEFLFQDIETKEEVVDALFQPLPPEVRQELYPGLFTDHFEVKPTSKFFYFPNDSDAVEDWTLLRVGIYCFASFQSVKVLHPELEQDFWYLPAGMYYIPAGEKIPAFYLGEGYVKSNWTTPSARMWEIFIQLVREDLVKMVPQVLQLKDRHTGEGEVGGKHHQPEHEGAPLQAWTKKVSPLPDGHFISVKGDDPNYNPMETYKAPMGLWIPLNEEKLYRDFIELTPQTEFKLGVYFFPGGMFMSGEGQPGPWFKIPPGFVIPSRFVEENEFAEAIKDIFALF